MRLSTLFVLITPALLIGPATCFPYLVPKAPSVRVTSRSRLPWLQRREDQDVTGDVQYKMIETTGIHEWKAPGPNDKRGPCPALNSMANHNYLPRNGVVNFLSMVTAVNEVFGIGVDLALPLSVYALLTSGDLLTLSWSIGGPAGLTLLAPILGGGKGLSGSHNKYETDSSVTHGDFYLFDGEVNTVQIPKFKYLLSLQENVPEPNWTLDVMAKHRNFTLQDSVTTNPYFFYGPFSGLLVSNAGHCFLPGMMANFSEKYPSGQVTKEILLSFFAIFQDPITGLLTHKKGHERIPSNWFRRPSGILNEYGLLAFAVDFTKMALVCPSMLKIGGNTGKVNSFVGIDLADLTGGVYKGLDLLNPNKLVCFVFQLMLAVVPDLFSGGLLGGLLSIALNLLTSTLAPLFDPTCPGIQQWNGGLMKQFPG